MLFSSKEGLCARAYSSRFARTAALFTALWIVGCGSSGSSSGLSGEAEHITKVGQLVNEYKSANSGNNPKSIDELKDWAINEGKAQEKDFKSTRDKEFYVIEPMAMMRGDAAGGSNMSFMAAKMPVIIHEAKGKNGKKYMVQSTGAQASEMPDAGIDGMTKGRSDKNMKPK